MTPYIIYVFFGYNLNVNYRNMTFVIDRVALAKQGDNVLGSMSDRPSADIFTPEPLTYDLHF